MVDAKSGVTGTGLGATRRLRLRRDERGRLRLRPRVASACPRDRARCLGDGLGVRHGVAFTAHLVADEARAAGDLLRAAALGVNAPAPRARGARALRERAFRARGCADPVKGRSPHRSAATASNFAFVAYAVNASTGLVRRASGAIDNLGKGAAGQAVRTPTSLPGSTRSSPVSTR